jgi:hypothetical protein
MIFVVMAVCVGLGLSCRLQIELLYNRLSDLCLPMGCLCCELGFLGVTRECSTLDKCSLVGIAGNTVVLMELNFNGNRVFSILAGICGHMLVVD